jgi:hypothetical protein
MTSQIALHWQWLRQNNATLERMEENDYEELDGKAEDNEWIVDDTKRPEWRKQVNAKLVVVGAE